MPEYVVEVESACKIFKETKALDNVSIKFSPEKIHGIIGRNGSGKTVLFKCICGFMQLDSGKICIGGNPVKVSAPQNMGIIIEQPGFIASYSGWKNLRLLAGIRKNIGKKEICDALTKVGLEPYIKKHVGKYSQGMRQRLGLAQAIMEKPRLLILDEPMNGLDKHGVKDIRQLLLSLKQSGVTVIISSHYAEDIDALCDTVHEMDAGKIHRIT